VIQLGRGAHLGESTEGDTAGRAGDTAGEGDSSESRHSGGRYRRGAGAGDTT